MAPPTAISFVEREDEFIDLRLPQALEIESAAGAAPKKLSYGLAARLAVKVPPTPTHTTLAVIGKSPKAKVSTTERLMRAAGRRVDAAMVRGAKAEEANIRRAEAAMRRAEHISLIRSKPEALAQGIKARRAAIDAAKRVALENKHLAAALRRLASIAAIAGKPQELSARTERRRAALTAERAALLARKMEEAAMVRQRQSAKRAFHAQDVAARVKAAAIKKRGAESLAAFRVEAETHVKQMKAAHLRKLFSSYAAMRTLELHDHRQVVQERAAESRGEITVTGPGVSVKAEAARAAALDKTVAAAKKHNFHVNVVHVTAAKLKADKEAAIAAAATAQQQAAEERRARAKAEKVAAVVVAEVVRSAKVQAVLQAEEAARAKMAAAHAARLLAAACRKADLSSASPAARQKALTPPAPPSPRKPWAPPVPGAAAGEALEKTASFWGDASDNAAAVRRVRACRQHAATAAVRHPAACF